MSYQRGTQWGLDSEPVIDWRLHAVCIDTDAELFFPVESGSTRAAKAICEPCPVRVDCLEEALKHREKFGVWGGKSVDEREQIYRCRSGRCRHPEHEGVNGLNDLVARIAELARQGRTDREIGKTVGRTATRVYEIRRAHGIKAGWLVRDGQ